MEYYVVQYSAQFFKSVFNILRKIALQYFFLKHQLLTMKIPDTFLFITSVGISLDDLIQKRTETIVLAHIYDKITHIFT